MDKPKGFFRGLAEKAENLWRDEDRRRELIAYIFFGVLTTLVNYLVYWLMTLVTGMRSWPDKSNEYVTLGVVSGFAAWVAAVLFAFVTNKKYVFRSDRDMKNGALREMALFFGARAASYLIFDMALYALCLYVMPDMIDKLLMNVLVVIFNYFMSRIMVFRKEHKKKEY